MSINIERNTINLEDIHEYFLLLSNTRKSDIQYKMDFRNVFSYTAKYVYLFLHSGFSQYVQESIGLTG